MDELHRSHLLLQHLPGAGAAFFARLLEHFGSAPALLDLPDARLPSWLGHEAAEALCDYRRHGADSELGRRLAADEAWLARHPEIRLLSIEEADYPAQLREIHRAPPLLFVRGSVEALSLPQIAMVGSRNPSPGGRDHARRFAAYLAGRGFAITSGLALGVDGLAHAGALDGGGVSVAVVGTGIDRVYPARHRSLAEALVEAGGAIVSEFPLGTSPQAANFPQRNRIISGLSGGTLVVEAALKSGSLITARYAAQQNREVFAIPGSIHNPLARGCHRLIREGATLVETAQDMVEQLGGYLAYQGELFQSQSEQERESAFTEAEQRVLASLGHDPMDLDTLAEHSDLPAGQLMALLVGLQLKGAVCEGPAGYERAAPVT